MKEKLQSNDRRQVRPRMQLPGIKSPSEIAKIIAKYPQPKVICQNARFAQRFCFAEGKDPSSTTPALGRGPATAAIAK